MNKHCTYKIQNENIKQARKLLGLTQEEMAFKLGIKRSLLGAYEEHRAELPASLVKKFFELYNIPHHKLWNFLFTSDFKPSEK